MVVEITPIGIQNLKWKFYIVWTVFNASFVPLVYFFYPETADRTLEDIDAYYRESPPLLVFRDKDVISSKRPAKYAEREREEIRRHSSATDIGALRRGSRIRSQMQDRAAADGTRSGSLEGEKGRGSVNGEGHHEYLGSKEV